ncbi:MAG: BlaI/MecI/CopY family transcriptional regulator [Candidatus Latescibacteria bacterium]|nr:BlaI/MecI/CopY family transcriptional regulator [Candidatus Latescibacterota bacterium]
MPRKPNPGLTDREAEIMSILWTLKEANVEAIRQHLANRPSDGTVRTLLGIMARRGLVAHDGSKYAKKYRALVPKSQAQGTAVQRLLQSLFAGSTEQLLLHLVDEGDLDAEQLKRLRQHLDSSDTDH